MDPARKPGSGAISVIAALAAVGVFWLVVPQTEQYKTYTLKSDLKQTLKAIQPPAGAEVVGLQTDRIADVWYAVGTYSTDLKSETLRAPYMQEFSRHGFVYKTEVNTDASETSLEFCRAGTVARLHFAKPERHPDIYAIFLKQSDAKC
jgi:hypothetical protein